MQEIIQGNLSIQQAAERILARNARQVFLITGSHLKNKSRELLPGAVSFHHFIKSGVNVNAEEIGLAVEAFVQAKADAIVAIGGGSVIDLAKSIIHRCLQEGRERPVFLAAPSTAGSGTEATHFAVVYQNQQKISLVNEAILPDIVILDPGLLRGLSAYQAAVSGMDALAQAVESYWNKFANDESKEYSRKAIALWNKHYRSAVLAPDIVTQEGMLMAAHFAGKAINITRTTGPHALSYYLTARHGVPHGQAVALFLPVFFLYNQPAPELIQLMQASSAMELMLHLQQAMHATGLATSFAELGIDKEQVMSPLLETVNQERFDNNPEPYDRKRLAKLFQQYL